jgi:hypothetical protein
MAIRDFADMTPEQLANWVRDVRPLLVAQQERSAALARRQALAMIGRPVRRAAPTGQEENADA